MSTHEMLELASLDALGLLSEDERRSFDAAFAAAAPALQAQIRAEQARMAADDSLLPSVQPPLGLRARVLAAVREAVQSVSGRQVAGRIAPDILPTRGVSPLWRAAAVGCLVASVVFAATTLQMRRQYDTMNAHLTAGAVAEQFATDFGPRFMHKFTDAGYLRWAFEAPQGHETKGRAAVLVNPETGEGEFLCSNLAPIDGEYRLVLLDEQGQPQGEPLISFQPTAGQYHKSFRKPAGGGGVMLAVISVDRSGGAPEVVLQARLA